MPDPFFLNTAQNIAGTLCRDAIWDGDRCNWVSWMAMPHGQTIQFTWRAHGPGLYEGVAGIAYFLAQVYRFSPDSVLRRTIQGALKASLSRCESIPPEFRSSLFNGWVGVAHSVLSAAEIMKDDDLLHRGFNLLLSASKVEPDRNYLDIINGSAGAIQGLLHSPRAFRQMDLIEAAARHGNNLLSTARTEGNAASWPTEGNLFLLGYAHGVAGIASALLELAAVTGESSYMEMAISGLEFERQKFDPKERAWPDLRQQQNPSSVFSEGWCHGSSGIGLSRLRAFELGMSGQELSGEIDAAVQRTAISLHTAQTVPDSSNFCLCHGLAGNAAFFLKAAQVLDRKDLKEIAEKVGYFGIKRHEEMGLPWQCGIGQGRENAGLMLGLAGIGLFFLQLYSPLTVSNVLLLENGVN